MSLDKKLSSDVVVALIVNLAQKARGIVFIPLIIATLGPAAYGVYVQIIVVANIFSTISRLGLHSVLIRYVQRYQNRKADLYYSLSILAIGCGLLASVLMYSFAGWLSSVTLGDGDYMRAFQFGSFLVPIYISISMSQNYFRSEMETKYYSIIDGVRTYALIGAVIFVLYFLNLSLYQLIQTVVLIEGAFALGVQLIVYYRVGVARPTFFNIVSHLKYSVPVMVTNFSGSLQSRADRLLLGFFLGPTAVGVYDVAYKFAQLLRIYANPIKIALLPEFGRLWEEQSYAECFNLLNKSIRIFLIFAIPSVAGFALIGTDLVEIVTTGQIAEETSIILPLLAIGIVLFGLEVFYKQLFYAAELTEVTTLLRGSGSILNIFLNIILIPEWGVAGAAISTVITYLMTSIGFFVLTNIWYGLDFPSMSAMKIISSSLIMYAIIILTPVTHYLLILLISPCLYFITFYSMGGFAKSEVMFVIETFQDLSRSAIDFRSN